MFLFSFFILFLIKNIKTQITISTETLKQNGGNQSITIPIDSHDYTQLVITSNGYLIKLNSDATIYETSNQIIPLQFKGVDSDACQINNNLIVILSADDKKLTFFNIDSESIIVSNDNKVNDYSDNAISLSCANDYFILATSFNSLVTIKLYYQTNINLTTTLSNIIDNNVSCTLFPSLYTVCFYSYTSNEILYYTLYNKSFAIIKQDDVKNINMEHQPNRDGIQILNLGVFSKRIRNDKVIFCAIKKRVSDNIFYFCNIGKLTIGNTNPLYLASDAETQEYAFIMSNTKKIRQCFVGIRNDNLYPVICRQSTDIDGIGITENNLLSVIYVNESAQFDFLPGQTTTGLIKILPNGNDQIINLVEFDNNAIGFILSDGINTVISVYYPKCSDDFSLSFSSFPSDTGTCYSTTQTVNNYYYDSLYHKYFPITGNANTCYRNADLSLTCTCDNIEFYPVPSDYEGTDYCWNINYIHNFYFFDNTLNIFKKCYNGCLTCSQIGTSEKDTKCILCDNSINLSTSSNSYYPVNNDSTDTNNIVCIDKDTIIIGYYFNINTNQFEKCDNSCKYCSNQSTSPTTLCSECALNYYPKSTTSSPNLECYLYSTSLDNWYVDAVEKVFKPCIISCKKCDKYYMENDNIENKCTECNTNYYILSNEDNSIPMPNFSCKSISTKPQNTILVSITKGSETINVLQYCNEACLSCSEISNDVTNPKCISNQCSSNYYPLYSDSTICINEVIKEDYFSHYYLNSNSGKYEECNIECNTCSDYNNYCNECISSYYFLLGTKFCYSESTKEDNFLLNTDSVIPYYELCYENCLTCIEVGDENDNKCTSCITGQFLNPFKIGQCTLICDNDQYFYVDSNLDYICVDECPNNYPYLDENSKRCYDDCVNNINGRVFLYENKCVENCPDDTIIGSGNKCMDGENCRKSYFKLKNDISNINDSIPNLINSYMEYYSSNDQHVNIYKNTNSKYTLLIYKNEECINDIKNEINFPDLTDCVNKIKKVNSIPENTLLTILLLSSISSQTEYKIYNNNNNIELSKKPCESLKTNVIVSIPEEYEENIKMAKQFLDDYNINLYDINDPFFTNVCFEFTDNGKDIILEDRIKVYFQNISYCEEGCELVNIDVETLQANCSCDVKTDFLNNIFDNSVTGDYLEMINDANIKVIKCYKNVFDFGHFIKNAGSYIMLTCIISQIPFLILYIINGLTSIRVNLFQFFLDNPPIRNANKNQNYDSNSQNELKENINNNNNEINNNNTYDNNNNTYTNNNNSNNNNDDNDDNNNENNDNYGTPNTLIKKDPKKLMVMVINNNYFDDEEPNSLDYSKSNYSSISNSIKSNTRLKKNTIDIYSETHDKSPEIKKKKINKKNYEKIDINKEKIIISNTESSFSEEEDDNLNTMELYDALIYDKRTFCEFYLEQLKEKQDILRTFFNKNPYEIFYIKVMVFIFGIGMFFIFNGLFYSESYISERYWTKKQDFMFILKNQITKCFYSSICVVILNFLIELLADSKNNIESLINKKKNNDKKFKKEISKILNSMERNYLIFIFIDFILLFFGWYYLSALCNVYHNSQKDWIIGCCITFLLIQLYPFLLCLIVASLRFIGLKCKFETAYKLSVCLSD